MTKIAQSFPFLFLFACASGGASAAYVVTNAGTFTGCVGVPSDMAKPMTVTASVACR